jgi:hypothetical protein
MSEGTSYDLNSRNLFSIFRSPAPPAKPPSRGSLRTIGTSSSICQRGSKGSSIAPATVVSRPSRLLTWASQLQLALDHRAAGHEGVEELQIGIRLVGERGMRGHEHHEDEEDERPDPYRSSSCEYPTGFWLTRRPETAVAG